METIRVYRNKNYFTRILFYALLLLTVSVYGYIARYNRHSGWDAFMLVLSVLFGLIAMMQLRRAVLALMDKNPVLVVDQEGILDNASYIQAGLIPWRYIAGAKVDQFKGSPCLHILIKDAESFFEELPRMKKGLGARYMELSGTPVIIHKNIVRADLSELAVLIDKIAQEKKEW
ncbi:MAG: STM3941 family protein [Chitinophagales bacterium]